MNSEWFSIGEFSKIVGLSIKTLRFYHEKGILAPTRVDESSGYRYYDSAKIDRARVISALRGMDFSIEEIAEILLETGDEGDILARLEEHKKRIAERLRRDKEIVRALDRVISNEAEAQKALARSNFQVEEKILPAMLVAGIRMCGKYAESGKGFAKLGRALGRHICGKGMCLYYDGEFKEEDADFEPCLPIGKKIASPGDEIDVRELPEVRALTLLHKGPYEELGRSYQRLLREVKTRSAEIVLPTREVYIKCPGMIFKGNPANYLTEIQLPLAG